MTRPLLALLLLLPLLAHTQTLERSFGLELTPLLGGQRISGTNNTTLSELERLDSLESGSFGYGLGLTYESRVDRIGFTTGIRYLRVGYSTLQQTDRNTPSGTFSDAVTAHYLAIPLEVNFYQDPTPNDRLLFTLGVSAQYHLGTRTDRTSFTGGIETGTAELPTDGIDYRDITPSFHTSFAYDRRLSTDWAIRFQPTFQFFLNGNQRATATTVANRQYYQIGLRVVVRRLFI